MIGPTTGVGAILVDGAFGHSPKEPNVDGKSMLGTSPILETVPATAQVENPKMRAVTKRAATTVTNAAKPTMVSSKL